MIKKGRSPKKQLPDGLSPETAMKVGSVPSEYGHIAKVLGPREKNGWEMVSQALCRRDDGTWYDMLEIRLKDGKVRRFYFDIGDFFGK